MRKNCAFHQIKILPNFFINRVDQNVIVNFLLVFYVVVPESEEMKKRFHLTGICKLYDTSIIQTIEIA